VKDPTSFYERHITKLKNEYQLQVCDFENEVETSASQDFIIVEYANLKLLIDGYETIHSNRNIKVIYITRPYSKLPFEFQNETVQLFECEMFDVPMDKRIVGTNVNKNVELLWNWIVNEEVPELKRR
jgi:hypothetical protein